MKTLNKPKKTRMGIGILSAIAFLVFTFPLFSSDTPIDAYIVKIKKRGGYRIYADNGTSIPYHIKIEVGDFENLKASTPLPYIGAIKPKKKKQLLFTLKPVDKSKGYSYSHSATIYRGDPFSAKHKDKYLYQLPIFLLEQ